VSVMCPAALMCPAAICAIMSTPPLRLTVPGVPFIGVVHWRHGDAGVATPRHGHPPAHAPQPRRRFATQLDWVAR
jgi:hypothetical protein